MALSDAQQLSQLQTQVTALEKTASDATIEIAVVKKSLEAIPELKTKLENESQSVRNLESVASYYKGATWITGVLVFLLFATLVGLGRWFIETVAAEVIRREAKVQVPVTQTGKWTAANKLPDGYAFEWNLVEKVDPDAVVRIEASPLRALPGVLVSVTVAQAGATCVMTLRGSKEAMDAIELPVEATMTITLQK